ncbi:hypothetical protein [uncultured Kordia sp.]|uniref:hypothetical protein n=1 Tax=uncultured Kordia sp. TaxID=507699 RepID=UPI002615CBA9|nr:hypothetical protein [uncultured Kordia sp.]
MKKRNFKSLALNKKAISHLEVTGSKIGGRGASDRLTECRNDYCVSFFNSCPWVC